MMFNIFNTIAVAALFIQLFYMYKIWNIVRASEIYILILASIVGIVLRLYVLIIDLETTTLFNTTIYIFTIYHILMSIGVYCFYRALRRARISLNNGNNNK